MAEPKSGGASSWVGGMVYADACRICRSPGRQRRRGAGGGAGDAASGGEEGMVNSTGARRWVIRPQPDRQPGHPSESAIRRAMAKDDAVALVGWWPRRILLGAALWLVGALLLFSAGLYFSRHRTATLPGDEG